MKIKRRHILCLKNATVSVCETNTNTGNKNENPAFSLYKLSLGGTVKGMISILFNGLIKEEKPIKFYFEKLESGK